MRTMAEERLTQAAFTLPHCPWCSAEITPGAQMCATCGAALVEPDASVPGVTAIDTQAISRTTRVVSTVRRSRLLSWISGEFADDDGETPATPGTLGPPPPDVRREMLRLEMEAEYANLKAEAESITSEAEIEARESSQLAPAPVDGSEPVANELRDEAVANELHVDADAETEAETGESRKDDAAS